VLRGPLRKFLAFANRQAESSRREVRAGPVALRVDGHTCHATPGIVSAGKEKHHGSEEKTGEEEAAQGQEAGKDQEFEVYTYIPLIVSLGNRAKRRHDPGERS